MAQAADYLRGGLPPTGAGLTLSDRPLYSAGVVFSFTGSTAWALLRRGPAR